MRKRMMVMTVALTLIAGSAFGADEMKKLEWMIGDWKGEATMQMGPGTKTVASQTEHIVAKQGGKLIVIEGLGKRKNADGSIGEVVHDALGVISWDARKNAYRFDAWTARDGYIAAWMNVADAATTWGFDLPGGTAKIRYTITRTPKNEWNEIGEYSPDGSNWMKFFEMNLTK
jgi:hypothetical protein